MSSVESLVLALRIGGSRCSSQDCRAAAVFGRPTRDRRLYEYRPQMLFFFFHASLHSPGV